MTMEEGVGALEGRADTFEERFDRFMETMSEVVVELKATNRLHGQRTDDHQQLMAAHQLQLTDHQKMLADHNVWMAEFHEKHEEMGREYRRNTAAILKLAERLGLMDDDAFKC